MTHASKIVSRGALVIAAAAIAQVGLADSDLEQQMANSASWASQAGDYANHRHSQLAQVNADNADKLQVAWTMSTGVLRGHEGSPLVIGDTMYMHTPFPNNVYAISLKDQTFKWKYEPKQDTAVIPVMCCDTVNRGVAYGDGKIFLQQADTTLVALDAQTGKVVWTAKNGDAKIGETNTNAPHVFKDKVITGISGGEFGVRGRLIAYDVHSGKKLWTAWSTGPDNELLFDPAKTMTWVDGKMAPVGKDSSLKTWQGTQWKLGGGTTWGWYSYDPKLNLVYYGSGNPGTWNPAQRPGDNKWSMTIFARDLDTGVAKWVFQMTPHDEWDFDGVNEMVLVDVEHRRQESAGTGALRPQRLWLHPQPRDRRAAGGEQVRSDGQLGDHGGHEDRPPGGRQEVLARHDRPRRGREEYLPGGSGLEGPAALQLRSRDQPAVCSDQPRVHDLRAVPGGIHRGPTLRGCDAHDVPGAQQPRWHGQLHRLGRLQRDHQVVACRSASPCGRACSPPMAMWPSTAPWRAT